MKIHKLNNQGVAVIETVILVVIVAAIAGIGAYVIGRSHAQSTNNTGSSSTSKTSPSGGSIALNQTNPTIGQMITFKITVPKLTGNQLPIVDTDCLQNNVVVWGEVDNVSTAETAGIKLGGDSSPWLNNGGGAANCQAWLEAQTFSKTTGETRTVLATTLFNVQ